MATEIVAPDALGIDPKKLAGLVERAGKEVGEGILPSAQIAIAKDGQLACFESFGDATDETMYCIFSCTKAFTSAAAWLLIQSGDLSTAEIVADIVPEFGTNGKEVITVEQLFLHTAGFPHAPFRPTDWEDRARRLERFSEWRLNWEPGSRYEYHPTSSMWMIAEIIERRSGVRFTDFVRERVIEPLGIDDCYLGLPERENPRVALQRHVGDPLTDADYASLGIPKPPVTEVTEDAILNFDRPDYRAVGIPGGGGIMTAAALALFYQGLLHGGRPGGPRVWSDATLEMGRTVISGDYVDPMFGRPINRALGIVVAGDEGRNFRGFGHLNSENAFGHGGAGGQIGWADPATGISIGYCTNGHDRHPVRQGRRGISISNKAAVLSA